MSSVLQQDYDTDNTKKKFSEDIALTKMGFDEIKKNLWEIVDDKRTKDRVRLKTLKQLAEVTFQSLELIHMAEILNRIEMMNKDLMERYAFVLEQEKSLASNKINSNESDKSKSSSDDDDE